MGTEEVVHFGCAVVPWCWPEYVGSVCVCLSVCVYVSVQCPGEAGCRWGKRGQGEMWSCDGAWVGLSAVGKASSGQHWPRARGGTQAQCPCQRMAEGAQGCLGAYGCAARTACRVRGATAASVCGWTEAWQSRTALGGWVRTGSVRASAARQAG